MKLHRGDTVKIITGKDRGKIGKIMKVDSKHNLLTLENLNMVKKHRRPRKQGEKGEIINVVRPLNASRTMLVCSNCKKPTRTGFRLDEGTTNRQKIRYCKHCKNPT